jgi:uncharacterized protein (TIGR03435 family)
MRRLLLVIAALSALPIQAQSGPAFDVISVKATKSDDMRRFGIQFLPGGRFVATNCPLFMMVAIAYNVPFQSSRLTGGPDWLRSARFDVEATAPKGSISPGSSARGRADQLRLMLQALLADRFKLTIHRETKESALYAIIVGKNGPKLEKASIEEKDCPEGAVSNGVSCHTFGGGQGRGLHGQAVDMSDLALYVANWTDHPVVDRTGLTSLYRIDTRPWIPLRPGPPPAAGAKGEDGSDLADLPSLFGVFEQLGLKLEPQKGPIEFLTIEHADRPSEN